jgi:hypothetical protein
MLGIQYHRSETECQRQPAHQEGLGGRLSNSEMGMTSAELSVFRQYC